MNASYGITMFRILENWKLKRLNAHYKELLSKHSDWSERDLLERLIQERVQERPHLYPSKQEWEALLDSELRDWLQTCRYIMEREHKSYRFPHQKGDLSHWAHRSIDLDERISRLVR